MLYKDYKVTLGFSPTFALGNQNHGVLFSGGFFVFLRNLANSGSPQPVLINLQL